MVTLNNIRKSLGARTLFEEVTCTFNQGCRYGLTGPNGAGKSTLMKIMMKEEPPTAGTVSLPPKTGFLRQNIEKFQDYTVLDTVIMGNERLWNALQERDALYEKEMTDAVGIRLGELEEVIGEEDGYTAEASAEMLLEGMGIPSQMHSQLMKNIPVDRQFRTLLVQALFGDPQALLLDEPTNHLDLESIHWLEGFLKNYTGTLIVVSHDRHFLNEVTTHIADIDYETLIIYPGNYDDMIIAKTQVRKRAELENKAKEKKVSQLKEFVAKFGAGTRASQVQSRIKEIAKLEPQELKQSNIQRPYIRFYPPEVPSGQLVFKVKKVGKTYEETPVFENLSLEIHKGDKIGIIGNNGRGKTTLLKMLAQVLQPTTGSIEFGHNVSLGYFPQNHQDIIDKGSSISLFDYLKEASPNLFDEKVRSILGKMLFSGEDAFKLVKTLSGGETARLILGKLMLLNPNTLILDEPNNHLDLEAVSALSWALQDFKGTAIVATHDRTLLTEFATKIIAFEEKKIVFFEGTLEEYLEKKS